MTDATRQRNPLLARLGALLEGALDRALALDPGVASTLVSLDGRRVGIELRGANLALALAVRDGKLRVGPHWESTSDLNVRAAPASLLAFALLRGDDTPLSPGKVEISGDASLARTLEKMVRDFRPDIEETFAQTFGDVIGVALAKAFRRAFGYAHETVQALAQDMAEFLREESRDLVAPAELEQFLDDVDAVRERADRLDVRVQRLLRAGKGTA